MTDERLQTEASMIAGYQAEIERLKAELATARTCAEELLAAAKFYRFAWQSIELLVNPRARERYDEMIDEYEAATKGGAS